MHTLVKESTSLVQFLDTAWRKSVRYYWLFYTVLTCEHQKNKNKSLYASEQISESLELLLALISFSTSSLRLNERVSNQAKGENTFDE